MIPVMLYEDSWTDDPSHVDMACRPMVGDEIQFDPSHNYENAVTDPFEIKAIRHVVSYEGTPMLAVLAKRRRA